MSSSSSASSSAHMAPSPPDSAPFSRRLVDEPELRKGLACLSAVLCGAVAQLEKAVAEEEEEGNGGEDMEIELEFALAACEAVVAACYDLPAEEGMTEEVETVFLLALQLCLLALEKASRQLSVQGYSKYSYEQLFKKLMMILELVLVEGNARDRGSLYLNLADKMVPEKVPTIDVDSSYDFGSKCCKKGPGCDRRIMEISGDIIPLLAGGQSVKDDSSLSISKFQTVKHNSDMLSLAKHFAVLHLRLHSRLLAVCKNILVCCKNISVGDKDAEAVFQNLTKFVTRILKLLTSMYSLLSYCASLEEVVNSLVEVEAVLAGLLEIACAMKLDVGEGETTQECCIMGLLKSFLRLAEAVIPDDLLFLNMRAYLAAIILQSLSSRKTGKEEVGGSVSVLEPQLVAFLLEVVNEIHAHRWKRDHAHSSTAMPPTAESGNRSRFQLVLPDSQVFALLEPRSQEELMQIVFPYNGAWLDKLISVLYLYHAEVMELRPKIETMTILRNANRDACSNQSPDRLSTSSEEEALFGNLFAETCKLSANSDIGSAQASALERGLNVSYNAFLQAAYDVLGFLNVCVFSLSWQKNVFEAACKLLNEQHVNTLLQIFFSGLDFHIIGAENRDHIASQSSSDMLILTDKANFDLLLSLVDKHVLTEALEGYVISQILEKGYYICSLGKRSLVLIAKILIQRSIIGQEKLDDPLKVDLWKSFLKKVTERARDLSWVCSLNEAATGLTSVLHMEVLLMTYHSVSSSQRSLIVQSLVTALKEVCGVSGELNETQFAVWSLICSRLVMAIHYTATHSETFPAWLLSHLRTKFQGHSQEDYFSSDMEENSLLSWAAIVGKKESVEEEHSDSSYLQQLFDVNGFSLRGTLDGAKLLTHAHLEDFLGSALALIDKWTSRSARRVEEFVVERYVFFIVWIAVRECGSGVLPENLSFTSSVFFMQFTQCLYAFEDAKSDQISKQWLWFFKNTFSAIENISSAEISADLTTWHFLRRGSSISLLLLFLQQGLSKVTYVKANDSSVQKSSSPKDVQIQVLCEQLAVDLVCEEESSFDEALKAVFSILSLYMSALRKCILNAYAEQHLLQETVDSMELLLRVGVSHGELEQLFLKMGVDFQLLERLLRWGDSTSLWQSEILAKIPGIQFGSGFLDRMCFSALLHGYPSCTNLASAAVMSCLMVLDTALGTLGLLLRARGSIKQSHEGWEQSQICQDLLSIVLSIISDGMLHVIHPKCQEALDLLLPSKEEQLKHSNLASLKRTESLLVSVCSKKELCGAVREKLILQAVENVNVIQADRLKADVMQEYFISGGCLSAFVDVLDVCSNKTVNAKVFQLLMDLTGGETAAQNFPSVELQEKFVTTDTAALSYWLEKRLLGGVEGSSPESIASAATRDMAMMFLTSLVSSSSSSSSGKDLRSHFVDALIIGLERAFCFFEVNAARAYFGFLVQLASTPDLIERVLRSVVELLGKLANQSTCLEGIKSFLAYLNRIVNQSGMQRQQLWYKSAESKHLPGGVGRSQQVSVVKKNSELLHAAIDQSEQQQSGTVPAADCDAISVDEDEDEGTSDGEVTCFEKDEDAGSEKGASGVCTFTSSGSNFMEQHWYFCYTCDLTMSKGCCSICARICHRGHKVVYSRLSRFFCDCGAGGVRGSACLCLKPRKHASPTSTVSSIGASTNDSFLPLPDNQDRLSSSDSDLDGEDDLLAENERASKLCLSEDEGKQLLQLLSNLDIEAQILSLCQKLIQGPDFNTLSELCPNVEVDLSQDKSLAFRHEFLQLKRLFKSGSFDIKIKAEYPNSRELKSHLMSGSIVKSLLSVSSRGRLAAGEGDKVSIFDVCQVIGQPGVGSGPVITVDKANVKPLSKNAVRFEIVHLAFNSLNESYLAVAGYEDCQVFTINPRGEVSDRLALELALQDAYIRQIAWVPRSQVQLMVVTNKFVKIYDLSQDNLCPVHYFTALDDDIADATLVPIGHEQLRLLVLSVQGTLCTQQIIAGKDPGACILTDTLKLPDKFGLTKGVSIHFSAAHRLLFLSYSNGLSLVGHLNKEATELTQVSSLLEAEQDGKAKVAGLHHWRETFENSRLFVGLCTLKANSVVAVHMGSSELQAQNLRMSGSSGMPRVDGIVAYRPSTKENNYLLMLHDDGSLQVFSFSLTGEDLSSSSGNADNAKQTSSEEKAKKLSAALLGSRINSSPNPVFPLDFFEKTTCITQEVRLGGDILRNNDSEIAKQNLALDDAFVEGPSPTGFKIVVYNSNPDIVMVGCRVHVGNTASSHIPCELRLFQRVIKLEEGVRCWYDIPFTNAEALVADEEFTLTVGPTFNGSSLPRIDTLEVYGRSKDDFGWKEKLEAVLNLDSQTATSSSSGCRSKQLRNVYKASVQEQIIADGLKLLCGYYLACRFQLSLESTDESLDSSRERCQPLMELIFGSDRHLLLQLSARRVIRALYPVKDAYYQAVDSLRLMGILRIIPIIESKIGYGGYVTSWAIQEFTSLMCSVCKILLHRKANLASFLESNGPSVIDGLMGLLWEILCIEQPDNQTINSLVIPAVDLIYGYAECLVLNGSNDAMLTGITVAPAVVFFRKLLFAPYEAVQASCSLAMSSRLLQVPFPKQTIVAIDDAGESSRANPIASDSGVTNGASGQVMMEEDGTTDSVQYCCDGCSTVPIVGRRWHCTICPDFDLCETCYEILDSDRLPPPHSREHLMTAISIEVDAVGAEGSDMHFPSIDDMGGVASGDALLQSAAELNLEPASSGDPNSCRDYSESSSIETKAATMSASTKALNSLILCRLTEEIKGWMSSFPGTRVIPLMQLFYKLASAPSGPFTEPTTSEGLDLEKFVKALLEEMVLSVPLSTKSRTSFGETIILLFSFFNLVLRNWHQPGSDHSQLKPGPGIVDSNVHGISLESLEKSKNFSQIERAWSSLRQQQLLNYIFAIIQQLSHLFKSSSHSQDSAGPSCPSNVACGALLTVRKEFATGSFAPYFSDSYAKAHRGDLFGSYHRLLLESAFRLAYSLVRPEKPEKLSDKEQMSYRSGGGVDLKLDGWQEVLCSYINNPYTTSIRRFARRLLLHICGSKGHYYNIRDAWQLSREVKKIYKLVQKSGFQSLNSYEKRVKLVKSLSVVLDVAVARPRNWQKYCLRHTDILQFFLNGIFSFAEESVVLTLKLLTLAFYTGKELGPSFAKADQSEAKPSLNSQASSKTPSQSSEGRKKRRGTGEDLNDGVLDKAFLDMEVAVDLFAAEEGKLMKRFIDAYLLEWNAASVRSEAKDVLYGAWHHGRHAVRALVLTLLLQRVPLLPSYGQNVAEYTDLLTWLLGKGISDSEEMTSVHSCLTGDVVKGIFNTLRSQNQLLANHPNSRIYNTLSSLVEFDGFYLESDPCLACSFPEVPYTKMKLESLKSETKFTDNRILVKCVGSHTIQSVTMNVHDVRRSKSVKVLNLYYNNRTVADLSELKNNWSLWKKAKSCHLTFNQTELKVEFPIPITACNFMIELDSFYENLQAASLESLQCPRCSRYVTDKHGICSNCHENAYQCRQCRNINYENLDSFLCNECGYSKYGRFEFNFVARPSFHYDGMENDDDMKKVLAAIETESENAHRKYQQLVGFKKPLLKLVSSIGEAEMDSQQKDSMQQMIVSLPGSSSFKINRKIAILGVLYGEKCKMAFDSLSRSVQTLQGLRRILTAYLEQKRSTGSASADEKLLRPNNRCYGCANTFVGHCLDWLQVLAKIPHCKQQLVSLGILSELFENNIHQGAKSVRLQARSALCTLTDGDAVAVSELNNLIKQKAVYCLEHHRSIDVAASVREELQLLSETCALADDVWEARLKVVFQLLFSSIKAGARHPAIAEYIILPSLKIISNACTPPKSESVNEPSVVNVASSALPQNVSRPEESIRSSLNPPQKSNEHSRTEKDTHWETRGQDMPLVNYVEWKNGSTYVDFIRRQYTVSQIAKPLVQKPRRDQRRTDYLALKYILRWKRRACKMSVTNELAAFEEISWVSELALSACSPAIRFEMCGLIGMLCSQSPTRRSKFLNLLMSLLPSTPEAGENAAEYFDLLFKMIESEDARLYLTVRGVLSSLCSLITEEVHHIEAQEHSFHTDISQGYILHKFIELLAKLLQVSNIRARFVKEDLLEQVLEALLVIKSLVVQKTKLIGDCGRLLRELLDSLLIESDENKKHFIRACIRGLQVHAKNKKNRTFLFILEQLCDIICPTKPESVYMMVLNKARTQEEYIRGSMTKNPYASSEIGALMRDVKNKICQQLDLLGLLEDDYGMELLVAGNIISLDLSIAQVYEQVWRKSQSQGSGSTTGGKECPPMAITYRLQGLEGEATEPMIKELEDNREESQDPEVEFAIAGVMWEYGGLEIILGMIQMLKVEELKLNPEELYLVLKLLVYCCKIRDNRRALLRLGALGVFLDTAHRAFSTEAVELAERLLLLVESLATEANESDISVVESLPRAGEQAANAMLMFLERLSHPCGVTKSAGKQQRNNDMIARILPYLTYGEQAAMEMLVSHFYPYLQDWLGFDELQKKHLENPKEESLAQQAAQHMLAAQNFIKVAESIKNDSYGERLKDLILKKEIPAVALRYLKVTFRVFEEGSQFKSTSEWVQGLESQAVPMILSMLRGLCKGHYLTQKCLEEEGVLPLLHALEGVSSDNEIGVRAENLMDMLANKDGKEGYLAEKVINLRHATRDEMRRRALRKREELLQGLGMRRELTVDGGERIVVSKPFEGIYDIEEEEESGLACMVCREGYSLRPADMLGTYCYCKYVNLGVGTTSQVRTEGVYTTVSHFNIIHFQCHQEAKRADSSLKNPKKEWEGATLRNNETLCNNLFPLRGPSVPLSQYIRCVDQYWDSLNTLGRADGSRFRLLSYDIVLMLARFATGASFSTDSKGGGKESNSQLLPFMLQMGWHLLEQAGASQRRSLAKALSTYLICPTSEESSAGSGSKLSSSPAALQRVGAVDETVQFMMVQSLFLESFDHWQRHRRIFLRHGIYHAYMQYKHGQSALPASSLPPLDSSVSESITNSEMPLLEECTESSLAISNMSHDQLFTMVKPMLVYTGLVDRLQRCFKLAITNQRNAEGSSERIQEGSENLEPWEADMKEKLRDIRVMLGFSNEFLDWLEVMQDVNDLQGAFSKLDVLGDVLSGGFKSCDDFVWDAINSAANR